MIVLLGSVLLVVAMGWWSISSSGQQSAGVTITGTSRHTTAPAKLDPTPASTTETRPTTGAMSSRVTFLSPMSALSAPPSPPVDPATVLLVDPPKEESSAADLSTPESATRAWMTRWCPFHAGEEFGAAQRRARSAMTAAGWAEFDPVGNDRAHDSWQQATTLGESGRCAAVTAGSSPEAPRTDTAAVVTMSTLRVITAPGRPAYVEPLEQTRLVLRGPDGSWRVDVPATGG